MLISNNMQVLITCIDACTDAYAYYYIYYLQVCIDTHTY